MGVDYRQQYKPQHLEPFFPHEIVKMFIVVLCTMAVLMFLVVLPTLFEAAGLEGFFHEEEPADPTVTPPHIRPEWYFLAVYQFLKLMPADFLGIDGKALGIFIQTIAIALVIVVPFWFPLRSAQLNPPNWWRGLIIFLLMLITIAVPAIAINVMRSSLPEQYRDILHPMFVWPGLALVAYLGIGLLAQRFGYADVFQWFKLFSQALIFLSFQYLAFILVLGQGLAWILPPAVAYFIGAVPMLITSIVIILFIQKRIRDQDEKSRTRFLLGFITEGVFLFLGLTIWAMWPAGEDGWHHEGKSFAFSVAVIAAAVFILYAFLATERRTICQTLQPEERDKVT